MLRGTGSRRRATFGGTGCCTFFTSLLVQKYHTKEINLSPLFTLTLLTVDYIYEIFTIIFTLLCKTDTKIYPLFVIVPDIFYSVFSAVMSFLDFT
jgi:hypothetical protein